MIATIKYRLTLFTLLCASIAYCQSLYHPLSFAIKNPEKTKFILVKGDSISLDSLNHNIDMFAHLSGLAVYGKVEKENSLWESLYKLRLLEQIILIDNDLKRIQIGGSSSTVKEIWISGSNKLNYESLNAVLSQTKYLQVLRLNGFDDVRVPSSISKLKLLNTAQFTNCNWTFKDIAELLKECKQLTYLDMSDNKFQIVGRETKFLPNLKYWDLSGNDLADSPLKMKYLTKLDTFIINRNKIENKVPTAEKLESLFIRYLILDKDSTHLQDKIRYSLPGKEIVWTDKKITNSSFVLPEGDFVEIEANKFDSISFTKRIDKYNTESSSIKPLSPAYIVYDKLNFPNPLIDFDTASFSTRYLNPDYIYTHKINNQNHTKSGYFYPLKYDKSHKNWYKKKRQRKLNHNLHSYITIIVVKSPKDFKGNVLINYFINTLESTRTELQAYKGLVWEAIEFKSKKDFEREFIKQKAWSDIRIEYDVNGQPNKLIFKGRFENKTLLVIALKSSNPNDVNDLEKICAQMSDRYSKILTKSESNFNRNLEKSRQRALRPESKEIDALWEIVKAEMSEEEKAWSSEEWMSYYEKIKKNEFSILAKHNVSIPYLSRYLESQGFKSSTGFDFYAGQKWMDFDLMSIDFETCDSISLPLKDYCLIDVDRKVVKYFKADKSNKILFEPFHQFIFVGQLTDNRVVTLNYQQILSIIKNGKLILGNADFVEYKMTNAKFYKKNILSVLNNLNY